jgi:sec-independent protein translocase protein TatA
MFRSPLTDGILVLVVLLLIIGPKKLPQLGRGLGDGMREFKEGITGENKDEKKQSLSQAQAVPGAEPTAPAQPQHAQPQHAQPAPAPTQGSSEHRA